MPALPAPRETPVQISVELRNQGSFTIPDEARKAHRCLIDIEVVSVTRTQYYNLQYNLPQGDYCNVTYWAGASICETRKVKYVSERLLDWVNIEGSLGRLIAQAGYVINTNMIAFAATVGSLLVPTPYSDFTTWGLNISHLKFVCPPDTQIRVTCQWYPFVEFDGAADADPDLDDPASGEDEYPSPRKNPPGDPWKNNEQPSAKDPERDARDYGDDNEPPPPPPPPPGPDEAVLYHVVGHATAKGYSPTGDVDLVADFVADITGPLTEEPHVNMPNPYGSQDSYVNLRGPNGNVNNGLYIERHLPGTYEYTFTYTKV